MTKHAKFISLEGIEGAGKSTALKFIQACLEEANIQLVVTREPGGTPLAEEIRNVLLHPSAKEKMLPEVELLLMFASRAQHIKHCIAPALHSGKWVLSDRYVDASYAYQGGGRGVPINVIAELDQMIVNGLYPTLTFLLDLPPEVGMSRTELRNNGKDRIEQEKMDFFARVRNTYLERARQDPKRIVIIDASQDLPDVEAQIRMNLDEFLTAHYRENE